MERDENVVDMGKQILDFNSHAHVERDRKGEKIKNAKSISTHTLTWSVTLSSLCQMIYLKHFNSHAHVERDLARLLHRNFQFISTHTLTWSVTTYAMKVLGLKSFQLTRSRGA